MRAGISVAAAAIVAALWGPVHAAYLAAPENVVCPIVDDAIAVEWDDVDGAAKYSVALTAAYPSQDGFVTCDFDFGTASRTDGEPASASHLAIPLAALAVDCDGDELVDEAVAFELQVKALRGTRSDRRQNHPFSAPCSGPDQD